MPAVIQRMVPRIQTSWKTVEVPPALFVGRVVEARVIMQMRLLSLRQCRSFWKSPSFPSLRSKLLKWFSSFHRNAFQSVDDVQPASATVVGKRKKKKKKGVVDAPTEIFHDEDSEMTALMSRLKGEWLEKSHAFFA